LFQGDTLIHPSHKKKFETLFQNRNESSTFFGLKNHEIKSVMLLGTSWGTH
jgi:hypothetical protein